MFPWSKTYNSLEVTGGSKNCFSLAFPASCRITRVVVIQVGGTGSAFTVRFFNNRIPCSLGSPESSGGDDPDGVYESSPETYEVFEEPLVGAAGEAQWEDSVGILYGNTDGNLSTREYKIYMEITPDEAGDMTFDVKFGCSMGQ